MCRMRAVSSFTEDARHGQMVKVSCIARVLRVECQRERVQMHDWNLLVESPCMGPSSELGSS